MKIPAKQVLPGQFFVHPTGGRCYRILTNDDDLYDHQNNIAALRLDSPESIYWLNIDDEVFI